MESIKENQILSNEISMISYHEKGAKTKLENNKLDILLEVHINYLKKEL